MGKNPKQIEKIASSREAAFHKVQIQYRRAAKPVILVSAEVLEDYGHIEVDGAAYRKEAEILLEQTLEADKQDWNRNLVEIVRLRDDLSIKKYFNLNGPLL